MNTQIHTTIHKKERKKETNKQTNKHVSHTKPDQCTHILLTVCHSAMFQPSKGHLQQYDWYSATGRATKWVSRCKILEDKLL